MAATDAQLANAALNAIADQPAGVESVTVDGADMRFNGKDGREALTFFERRAARVARTRPVCFSVKLG